MKRRTALSAVAAMGTAPLFLSGALHAAQSYPAKAITIVVPFPAGGTLDNLTRSLGQVLSSAVGQSVIVDNRPGAGTTIGTEFVARAPSDGYVLGMVANSFAINPSLYDHLRYKTPEDFTPISLLAYTPHVLVTNPNVSATTLAELVRTSRNRSTPFTFASFGNGTSPHIAIEVFKNTAHIDATHVPYKGQAPALSDLLGGHVDMMFANLPDVLAHIQSGRLRALAISNPTRVSVLPELITFKDAGFPQFESNSWYGLVGPKGLPDEVVQRLGAEISEVLRNDAFRKRLSEQGLEVANLNAKAFAEFLQQDIRKAAKVVKASGASNN